MTEQDATHDPTWGRRQYDCDLIVRSRPEDGPIIEQYALPDLEHTISSTLLYKDFGAVRAANIGLWLSYLTPAPFVMFLDDDARIPEGDTDWLSRMLAYFDKDPLCGCVGATTAKCEGTQEIIKIPPTFTQGWTEKGAGRQGHTGDIAAPYVRNFACMWRKDALKKCRDPDYIFDERFEPGCIEDIDMCIRLRGAGYSCVVAQDVYIHHEGSATLPKLVDREKLYGQNVYKLVIKWGPKNLEKLGIDLGETTPDD